MFTQKNSIVRSVIVSQNQIIDLRGSSPTLARIIIIIINHHLHHHHRVFVLSFPFSKCTSTWQTIQLPFILFITAKAPLVAGLRVRFKTGFHGNKSEIFTAGENDAKISRRSCFFLAVYKRFSYLAWHNINLNILIALNALH